MEQAGPVLTVTLNRPERRNAQTPSMWRALAALGAGRAPQTRVVVVRAEGPSFSAGLDLALLDPDGASGGPGLAQLGTLGDAELTETIRGFQEGFSWLRDAAIISIAAVQGHAIGAGFQLALACDMRVLAADAQLAMREPSLGLVPDLGGTKPLVAAVGFSRALEICATGRWVGAAEALQLGLANTVVPRDQLAPATDELVAAVLQAPAGAIRETKALLAAAADQVFDDQLAAERAAQARRLREFSDQRIELSDQPG